MMTEDKKKAETFDKIYAKGFNLDESVLGDKVDLDLSKYVDPSTSLAKEVKIDENVYKYTGGSDFSLLTEANLDNMFGKDLVQSLNLSKEVALDQAKEHEQPKNKTTLVAPKN